MNLYFVVFLYSIYSLYFHCITQVIDGKLSPFLLKVIKFATSHVYSCSLCSEKGFICELCQNSQVIYPFQESASKRWVLSAEKAVTLRLLAYWCYRTEMYISVYLLYCCLIRCICNVPHNMNLQSRFGWGFYSHHVGSCLLIYMFVTVAVKAMLPSAVLHLHTCSIEFFHILLSIWNLHVRIII